MVVEAVERSPEDHRARNMPVPWKGERKEHEDGAQDDVRWALVKEEALMVGWSRRLGLGGGQLEQPVGRYRALSIVRGS